MAASKKKKPASKSKNQPDSQIPADIPENGEAQEQLKTDFLDDFLFHAANYIYVRRKIFITIAVVLVVVLLSSYGTYTYIEYRDTQRNEQLFKIERIIFDTSLELDQQLDQAMPLLNTFISEHEDTEQQILARFYRAGLYFETNNYEEAAEDLKKVIAAQEPGSDLYVLASIHLANVMRDQGNANDAVEILQAAKTEAMTDIVLMEQAEIYMSSNQNDKARETLQVLLKDYPKSFYASKAKQLLEIL